MLKSPATRPTSKRTLVLAGSVLLVVVAIWLVYGHKWTTMVEISEARRELAAEQPSAALDRLERLQRRFPQHDEVLYWLAVANRRLDKLSAAETLLAQAEQLGADADSIALQRALINCRAGHFQAVEQLLRSALEQGVTDEVAADIYDAMATGYVASFRFRDAWQCLDFWKEWQPTAIKPRLLRAAISDQAGNREEALVDLRVVLATDPAHAEARRKLGLVLLELNRVEEALVEFRTGLTQHPDDAQLKIDIAGCQRRLGQLDEAAAAIDALLKERLTSDIRAQALRTAGEVQLEIGKYDQALHYFNSAVQYAPKDPRVHYDLFRALTFAGQTERAQVHQKLHQKLQDDTQRLRRITVTLIDEPNRADLRYEAGEILSAAEFHDEAVGWWMSALRVDPDHLPSHVALAEYHRRKGNRQLEFVHRQEIARLTNDSANDADQGTRQSTSLPKPKALKPAKEGADGTKL